MRTPLILLFLGLSASSAFAADTREITREWPSDGIARIDIEANVGTVTITGSDRDDIRLTLEIEPDDDWGNSSRVQEMIDAAELDERRSGDTLVLDLRLPRHNGDNDIEEHWELLVPSSIAALVELNVGAAKITGTRGGVNAEVNVGELRIEALGGDIDAEVNVGDLTIRSKSASPGEFDLETNIGNVDLEIGGKDAGVERGWLGGRIRHDAEGDDDVDANVNVGDLSVEID